MGSTPFSFAAARTGLMSMPLRVTRTAFLVVITTWAMSLFYDLDLMERIGLFVRRAEAYELDEILLLLPVLSLAIAADAMAHRSKLASERATAQAQQDAARRFAAQLHDDLGQSVAGLNVMVAAANNLASESQNPADQELKDLMETISLLAQDIAVKVKRAQLDTDIDWLCKVGLFAACEEHATLVSKVYGIDCSVRMIKPSSMIHSCSRLDIDQVEHAFRIIQEAVQNAVKHARSKTITVIFTHSENRCSIRIHNDGQAFSTEYASGLPGVGLRNMRYRAQGLGAELDVGEAPEGGTQVILQIPCR